MEGRGVVIVSVCLFYFFTLLTSFNVLLLLFLVNVMRTLRHDQLRYEHDHVRGGTRLHGARSKDVLRLRVTDR